tara:strand:- start:478 stop:1077 length:600 start_codon:yes stop_codon:yes gene_type:complete
MGISVVFHFSRGLLFVSIFVFCGGGCGKNQNTEKSKKLPDAEEQEIQFNEMPVTPAGQLSLAIKHYTGEGKPKDYTKAAKYFKLAAENGSHEAQFALGCMYQSGHGVTQNFIEATSWYLKAAQADNPNAQFLLGLSYKDGSGVPRDPLESYKWIYLAAEGGNTQHIAARQQLDQTYSPAIIHEGKRRAEQFRLYQGVNN